MATRVKYDSHYAQCDAACGEPFAPFAEVAAEIPPPASVLDLGCGQGRDALLFARAGHRVVGVDISAVGIEQLRAVAAAEGLDLSASVADVCGYEPAEQFDVVILDRVLHMIREGEARSGALAAAAAATRAGGLLLISEYPKQLPMLRSFFASLEGWEVLRDRRGFFFVRAAS